MPVFSTQLFTGEGSDGCGNREEAGVRNHGVKELESGRVRAMRKKRRNKKKAREIMKEAKKKDLVIVLVLTPKLFLTEL